MEDAIILNKSSYERGFGHTSVYKTIKVDIKDEADLVGSETKGDKPRMKIANKKIGGRTESKNGDGSDDVPVSNKRVLCPNFGDGLNSRNGSKSHTRSW